MVWIAAIIAEVLGFDHVETQRRQAAKICIDKGIVAHLTGCEKALLGGLFASWVTLG